MDEYIHRWEVAHAICKSCGAVCCLKENPCSVLNAVIKAPGIGIVRCKECKYFKPTLYGEVVCQFWDDCQPTNEDDYCSHGEWRSDNG